MAYNIYSKAGTDEAISSALADSLPTAPADIGAATAAQGALADATTVEQVALTANLAYALPAGTPAGVVHRVVFTQNNVGGHTVTYGGQPVTVALGAGASTVVELHPVGAGYVVRYPATEAPIPRGCATSAAAPLLSSLPIVAETTIVAAVGYNASTGIFYGVSSANGHFQTSPDLAVWTDRTYSPSTYTPGMLGWEFDDAYMYAYGDTGKVWRAPLNVFNAWTEITPPSGPRTTGRPGVLCALASGVLLYGNYTSSAGDGAHVWRSTDAGATWTETLGVATAKHVHAIRRNPSTGNVWASVGDAGFPGMGLYKSQDGGLTWTLMSSNEYGIDMVFVPPRGQWPALVVLEGDGLNRPHLIAFPEHGAPGEKTFPLVWGWSGLPTDPLSWRGTTRGLAVLPEGHLVWYTTTESGATGSRAGVWLAEAPDYRRVILLRETTGAEPNYGTTFSTSTHVQNLQRRFPAPTFGSY